MREWQTVTVAFAASSSRATGTPTSFERPTTTASAPSSSTPSWREQLDHPGGGAGHQPRGAVGEQAGVERASGRRRPWPGRSPRRPRRGRSGRAAAAGRGCRRRRRPRRARATSASSSSSLVVGRQPVVDRAHPDLLAGLVLVADVDLRGGVLADDHRRQGRRPPGLRRVGGDLARDPLPAPRPPTALPSIDPGATESLRCGSPLPDRRVVGHQLALRSRRRRSGRRRPLPARPR